MEKGPGKIMNLILDLLSRHACGDNDEKVGNGDLALKEGQVGED